MKIPSCLGCPCEPMGHDFSAVEGLGSLGVMCIAEASGEAEARDNLPLRPYAPSGAIYERTLRRLGFDRDQFATTNILRCRPRDNLLEGMYYESQAIAHCQPNLLAAISQHRPRVLVAFGNVALRALTGWSGEKKSVSHLRGFALRALPQFCQAAQNPDICVVPTFHPAFLRRGAIHLSGVLARDIYRAVQIARGKDKSFVLDEPEPERDWDYDPATNPDPWDEGYEEIEARRKSAKAEYLAAWLARNNLNYNLRPSLRDVDLFCRDVKAQSDAWLALPPDARAASYLALSADIETHESASLDEDATDGFTDTIVEQIQFSIAPAQGIALAWDDEHQLAARFLLRLPLPKVGHNWWLFDQKVLRAVGQRTHGDATRFAAAGTVYDTLQQFHYWQPDLPAHLQAAATYCQFPFPWKHLAGSNLSFYGCVDTDATLRVYQTVRRTMEDRGIWLDPDAARDQAGYLAQVQSVRPILADMEDRGLPVDDIRRLALDKEFDAAAAEVFVELDARFPDEARKCEPKEGYKGVPPRVKALLKEGVAAENVCKHIFQAPGKKNDDGTVDEGESFYFKLQSFTTPEELVLRWCRIYEFSPNSSKQLIRYMQARRHKVPVKKGGAQTTEKKELERLAAKHSDNFYFKVIEYRELTKMRGTYIDGYRPHADGCVHTTFTFDTATSQTSSRNPNVQNVPKNSRLADSFRAIIRHPEKLIVEWDYKSFHVLTTGFEAKSPEYMRMARLDMHSFIAWHFLRIPGADELYSLPDDELREKLSWFKKDEKRKYVRDKQAKPCIAEGELVLTDKGLVPIEKVTLEHRLWDGVEWVTHEGVICQGVKEVLLHDGLKATKCHKVVTRDGRILTHAEGMRGMVKLESTGSAGQAIPTRHRDLLEASARERLLEAALQVCDLRSGESDRPTQSAPWEDFRLSALRAVEVSSSACTRETVRCDYSEMHAAHLPGIQALWGPGHRESFRVARAIRELGGGESSTRELFRGRDRPQEQRWPLRAWEFEAVLSQGAVSEPAQYCLGILSGSSLSGSGLAKPLWAGSHSQAGHDEAYWGTNNRDGKEGYTESRKKLRRNSEEVNLTRVYDIANAGPRKCYTVSGKLVANCILGIGFGLGVEKMFNMNLEHFENLQQAKKLKDMVQRIFPRVFAWQNEVRELAHRQTYLKSRYGAIRWFYEVKVPDGRGGMRSGEQSEEAVAYLPATSAFGHIRSAMRELEHRALCRKWSMVNTVHDSLLFLVPPRDLDEHCVDIHPILTAPSRVLIDPVLAPGGLSVDVEASAGISWAKRDQREVKIPTCA